MKSVEPARRYAGAALLLLVVIAVAVVVTRGSDPYEITARFVDAGQLVDGNEVRIGGATVGTVGSMKLGKDGAAEVTLRITDDSVTPMRRGTLALIRNSSVSSIAGRYVALELGSADGAEIASGGYIETVDTRAAVDFDQFLNAVDIESRRALQNLFRDGAATFTGSEVDLGETLEKLNPALSQVRGLTEQLGRDEPALQRLLVSTAAVAGAFADRRDDVETGIASAAATVRTLGERREELRRTIAGAPALLKQATTTLRDADVLLQDTRPVLRAARPVAPRLANVLRIARPTVATLTPVLRELRKTLPVLDAALAKLPAFERASVPGVEETTRAVKALQPTVQELLPYTPDVLHGLLSAFGGRTAAQYDANGHFTRIALNFNTQSLPALLGPLVGALDPLLQQLQGFGISAPSINNLVRCPGGATVPSPDGSRPGKLATPPTTCANVREGS